MAEILTQPVTAVKRIPSSLLAIMFTTTIFLSATLLFSVQPMFTKLILPLLGGASNVWNTAMVFFQAMLLGGYVYAHLSSRYLSLRVQIGLHVAITVIGLTFLPLAIGSVAVPESGTPTLWLLGLFAATVGAPFFALSANAPLLQKWFSLTDHADAKDPYFLYSASNAASLLILCAYPILIEPALRLGEQTSVWTFGYVGLIILIGATGLLTLTRLKPNLDTANIKAASLQTLSFRRILFWLMVSFIPSSLMLGVTSHMTSNIASVPMLWIVPLALYLLTFVIVFARRPMLRAAQLRPLIPWVVLITLFVMFLPVLSALTIIAICLTSFLIIALYCHACLVESRPDTSRLTLFYIVMSLGGVMGGVFNALAAPLLFVTTFEYPLVLFLAAFILPAHIGLMRPAQGGVFKSLGLLLVAIIAALVLPALGWLPRMSGIVIALIVFAATLPLNIRRAQSILILATLVITAVFQPGADEDTIHRDRSFYATMSVEAKMTPLGPMHSFIHGDTVHNFQLRAPEFRTRPGSYYAPGGSFDRAISAVRKPGEGMSVALIGLGAGALSCYEQSGDRWTYFEIDPAVISMARNPDLFSFLDDCAPSADIRVGDARQTLASLANGSQDMIIIDAFSSGSIPAHLVTREAMTLYRSKLSNDGLIFFHTSNRMMDVTSVVVRVAEDAGLASRFIETEFSGQAASYSTESNGLLIGPDSVLQRATAGDREWTRWVPSENVGVWTDDYSAIISAIRAKMLRNGRSEPIRSTD